MPPLDRLPPTPAHSWQGAAPAFLPHDGLAKCRDPQPCTAPQQRLCQRPSSRTCSQDGRRAALVSKYNHRPSPFSSVRASRPPHQPAGLAEGLLLTADTFGLTVNNKTKSLCTALQTLLHTPGYVAELYDSGRPVLHSTYRVLAGNISFPLTTNTSGYVKKGILPPREIKIVPLSKQKLPGFV